jgi:predicted nucleic acid binding AN1-type Zn finger protein
LASVSTGFFRIAVNAVPVYSTYAVDLSATERLVADERAAQIQPAGRQTVKWCARSAARASSPRITCSVKFFDPITMRSGRAHEMLRLEAKQRGDDNSIQLLLSLMKYFSMTLKPKSAVKAIGRRRYGAGQYQSIIQHGRPAKDKHPKTAGTYRGRDCLQHRRQLRCHAYAGEDDARATAGFPPATVSERPSCPSPAPLANSRIDAEYAGVSISHDR